VSKGKLLLADDSLTIQKVVNLTFADEGIEVLTAGNGDLALEMINASRPDVVLADVNMPGLSGYEICERIRNDDLTKDLPVLLLVGSFEPFDEDEAHRVGANGYLTKPFQSIRLLVSQVSDLMEASTSSSVPDEPDIPQFDESAEAPAADEPETSDIDELYQKSFADTAELTMPEPNIDAYADVGMDDELIETSYSADEPDSEETFADAEQSGYPSPFGEKVSNETDEGSPETGTENDLYVESSRTQPIFEAQAAPEFDSVSGPDDEPGPEMHREAETISAAEAAADDAVRFDQPAAPPTAESFNFDEINLLDLPPVETVPTIRFTAPGREEATGSSSPAVSLSPELIDLIVQKVVEKLSEKDR